MSGHVGVTGIDSADAHTVGNPPGTPWHRIRVYWSSPTGIVMIGFTALAFAIRLFTLTRSGYLTGVTEYDDGVYLGGAIRLLQGQLPFHDFAFVQPPGILLLLLPVALLTKVTTVTHALGAARILTVLASTAGVPLSGSLLRHRGVLVTAVTCGIMAVYPDDITTAHTLILEPWMNLLALIGVCLAFRQGRLASPRRLLWAGVLIGAAMSVKFWAGLPALVLLAVCLVPPVSRDVAGGAAGGAPAQGPGRWQRAWRCLAGLVIGFGVPTLPFALTAPVRFIRSTVLDQASRDGTYVPHSMRLAHITGLIDFLNSSGHLALRAGTNSLFASGGAAATPGTSAGWPPYLVFLIAVVLIAAGYALQPGRPSPLETFALVTAFIAICAIVLYSAFFYHYPAFVAPWIAITAGGAFGALSPVGELPGQTTPHGRLADWLSARFRSEPRRVERVRNTLTGVICSGLVLLSVFQAQELSGLAAPDVYHSQAVIPAGACVVTDQVSMTISANRFTATNPGCPDIVDALAETLVLSNGVSIQGGASGLPHVVAAWKSILGRADYVWLHPNNWRRIPWTPGLTSWFHANFVKLDTSNGLGEVYKRVGG